MDTRKVDGAALSPPGRTPAADAQGGGAAPPSPDRAGPPGRLATAFLRFPLFYKILLANWLIVEVGIVVGVLASHQTWSDPRSATSVTVWVLVALIGLLVTLLVNALIVRVALSPLHLLERTAARVRQGDLDARVPPSSLADREMERLTETFNAMLDALGGYRQRLRDVAARALNAEEEERKRIARELHDETAQALAALLLRLRLARTAADAETRDRLLTEIRDEIAVAIEGIRRFARGLRPPALDELGLVPALEAHARTLAESAGLDIQIESSLPDGALAPAAELGLYRIVQEALSNVVRHAAAGEARVHLSREHGAIVAVVEDDGAGFPVDEVMAADASGLGLFGMQERAAYLGGTVTIRSHPGRGTQVRAEVPIEADLRL